MQGSIYWGGRGEASSPQTSQLPPQKKFYWKKNLQLFQKKDTTILRNQWRLLMSRNAISANPKHCIFKKA